MSNSASPPAPSATHGGLIALFANHRVAANLLMFLFILAGLWGLKQLNSQFFPEFELEYISIQVPWRGASAEDVERAITVPLEQSLTSVTNIRKLTSTSRQGMASLVLELEEGSDVGTTLDKVKQQVDSTRNLPEDAERPVVTQIEQYSPIANVLVTGPQSLDELDYLVSQYEHQLLQRGIRKINLVGSPSEEIAIQVSADKLPELGLSLVQIAELVRQNSQDSTAGTAAQDDLARQVRSLQQQRSATGFANLPLRSDADGRLIRLGDVATIERRARDNEPHITWQGKNAIEMILMRTSADDTLTMANILNEWHRDVQSSLPDGVELTLYNERYQHLRERIQLLLTNGASGMLLVIATLFLFLNVRVAFWVMIGIPVSFMATLAVLYFVGGSINMISLFALIMALGIIVDDAIVVGEDTLTHHEMGESAQAAAIGGARRMLPPVLSSSLTTIAAFLPLTMIGGVMGNIIFDMPLVIICVIIASLVECFLILPGHLHHGLKRQKPEKETSFRQRFDRAFNHFKDNRLRPFVDTAIRYRGSVICAGVGMFILALSLIISGHLRFTFFPSIDGNTLQASVEFTPGTPESEVSAFLAELETALYRTEQDAGRKLVKVALTYHGRSFFSSGPGASAEIAPEKGAILVDLVSEKRILTNTQLINQWRENVALPPGIDQFKIDQREMGPGGPPLAFQLIGPDIVALKQASLELQDKLAGFSGVHNIRDDMPYGRDQLIFELSPEGRRFGLSTQSLGAQMRAAFDGALAQLFYDGDKEIEVRVMLPDEERKRATVLDTLPVIGTNGQHAPLDNLVHFTGRRGIDELHRTNGVLNITVTADVDTHVANANQIKAELDREFFPHLVLDYGIRIDLEGRAADQAETLEDMKLGLVIGLTLIYIILAWVFAAYSWPLAVMSAIPLGLTGAVLGHFVMNQELSMFSLLGFFGLSGIVINDSIVLISFYGQLRDRGINAHDAIVNAIVARFRAVLLTSLTTIAGLLPIMFETSLQAQFLIPMAISIVFGLAYGTFLILLFVPAMLMYLEGGRQRLDRWRQPHLSEEFKGFASHETRL